MLWCIKCNDVLNLCAPHFICHPINIYVWERGKTIFITFLRFLSIVFCEYYIPVWNSVNAPKPILSFIHFDPEIKPIYIILCFVLNGFSLALYFQHIYFIIGRDAFTGSMWQHTYTLTKYRYIADTEWNWLNCKKRNSLGCLQTT